ncbi:MAG: glutaredoxin [Microgenomates group bacterium]
MKPLFHAMKKALIALVLFGVLFSFGIAKNSVAQTNDKVSVVIFVRQGCTHCEEEQKFLTELAKKRTDFTVKKYNLEVPAERAVWERFTEQVKSTKVTPITIIGKSYIIGFDKPETTGKDISQLIDSAKKNEVQTSMDKLTKDNLFGLNTSCDDGGLVPCSAKPSYFVNLPFLGRVDAQQYPLLILSAMFGFFDGFNPCAMWVLISFLMILLQVGNKKKMVLFAGTFILAEAIMYSLILVVWYKTWDFVRLDNIITPLVGIVSVIGGFFFLKEWRKKELECKVTDYKQRKQIREKITFLASSNFTFFTFLSILGVAFSVNIIEFACSIGIPQAFTKILELNRLPAMQNVLYIATYILFYMIDDLIVFGIALYGIDKLSLTTKYSKISNLIGGIVMVLLGLIMILKPSIILF